MADIERNGEECTLLLLKRVFFEPSTNKDAKDGHEGIIQ